MAAAAVDGAARRETFYPADDDLINLCARFGASVCSFIIKTRKAVEERDDEIIQAGVVPKVSLSCDLYTTAVCGFVGEYAINLLFHYL